MDALEGNRMNKEWQKEIANKRQDLIKKFHQMNDNPLDEIYPQYKISDLREGKNYWYNQAQQLKDVIQKINQVCIDWEWHYCPNGTPQRYISDLLVSSTEPKCCLCNKEVDTTKHYGVNDNSYYCHECINDDY